VLDAAFVPDAAASPDVDALVDAALDRRDAERAERAEAAEYARATCPTGCCRLCGIETCLVAQADGSFAPTWHQDGPGHHCELCDRELWDALGVTAVAGERKVAAARSFLGLASLPMRAVGDPSAFETLHVWHFEHPGAPPAVTEAERWQHVNRDALREQWEAIAEPRVTVASPDPGLPRRDPCPRCGAACPWMRAMSTDADWHCRWCDHHADYPDPLPIGAGYDAVRDHKLYRSDADEVVAGLLGLSLAQPIYGDDPIAGLAKRAGFRWAYEATRGDRHGQPPPGPWAYVDLAKLRRRAGLVETNP
jgi:hypothetical protein